MYIRKQRDIVVSNANCHQVIEVVEAVSCICIAFVDSDHFLTGSSDSMLRLWQINRKDSKTSISRTHLLRAHEAGVLCVATCRSWSIAVSGSEDGTAVIWDLNRAVYVRSIVHKPKGESGEKYSVYLVAINQSTVSITFKYLSLILSCRANL